MFVNSGAADIVFVTVQAQQLKQQLRSAQVAGQWRGDTALTLPLFLRRSTVSPVLFGGYPRSIPHSEHRFPACRKPLSGVWVDTSLFRPLPTLSPSLIGHLASVDVKQHESMAGRDCD